jgi:hypothetical protein
LDETLPAAVAQAKGDEGRSAVESFKSWGRPPVLLLVTPDWIGLFHSNGWFSRISKALPDDPIRRMEAALSRSRIHRSYGQGVEQVYEFMGPDRWVMRSLHRGVAGHEVHLVLSHVVDELPQSQVQAALDLDPAGASRMSPRQLDEAEMRVLRSLIEEWPSDTIEEIRLELVGMPTLTRDQVEDGLDFLFARGYVEESGPGRWQATKTASWIKGRLLGPLALS